MTKEDILNSLSHYQTLPDDDNIRIKKAIKNKLLSCPELLVAMNYKLGESEIFDSSHNIVIDTDTGFIDGASEYFGSTKCIFDSLIVPSTQTTVQNLLFYQSKFDDTSHFGSYKYNQVLKQCTIVFTILCHEDNITVAEANGMSRHDLISAIIKDKFDWTNITSTQWQLVSDQESTTDTHYVTRTLVYMFDVPNGIVKTTKDENGLLHENGISQIVNNQFIDKNGVIHR